MPDFLKLGGETDSYARCTANRNVLSLLARRYAPPEFIEGYRVKECDDFDNLSVPHLHEPSVGVAIGLTVHCCGP
ncbi:hypothetical protein H6G76_34625 [Nostoc sp. FACHB-152]|uniref:hypothetical protein n=1 Tax=Nostoc sp. FACHB-152 TaxID=2692837 RepID=UPI001681F355|nr:hypothetical protein [Nostoc sp. FACHB-152]MBD2452152.1 hypothetical protein [Nostoc sp. FACHB-152]